VSSPAERILVDLNEAALMREAAGFMRCAQHVPEPRLHALVLDHLPVHDGEVTSLTLLMLDGIHDCGGEDFLARPAVPLFIVLREQPVPVAREPAWPEFPKSPLEAFRPLRLLQVGDF